MCLDFINKRIEKIFIIKCIFVLSLFIFKFFKLVWLYGNFSVEDFDKKCYVVK